MIFGGEEEEDGGLGEEEPPPPVFPKLLDLRFKDPKVSQGLEIDPEGTRVTSNQSTPAVLILSEPCNPEPYTREDFPEDELPGLYEESYGGEPQASEEEVSQGDAGSQQVDEEGQADAEEEPADDAEQADEAEEGADGDGASPGEPGV